MQTELEKFRRRCSAHAAHTSGAKKKKKDKKKRQKCVGAYIVAKFFIIKTKEHEASRKHAVIDNAFAVASILAPFCFFCPFRLIFFFFLPKLWRASVNRGMSRGERRLSQARPGSSSGKVLNACAPTFVAKIGKKPTCSGTSLHLAPFGTVRPVALATVAEIHSIFKPSLNL